MQFFDDYFIFVDGLALLALVIFALIIAFQNKGFILVLIPIIAAAWAVTRFFNLV